MQVSLLKVWSRDLKLAQAIMQNCKALYKLGERVEK